jgi:hypothetical protein
MTHFVECKALPGLVVPQNLIRRACIRFTAAAAMMMPEPVADFVSEEHPWNSYIALSLSHWT